MQVIRYLLAMPFVLHNFILKFKELREFYLLVQIQLGNHASNLTEEELETHTISAWKEGKSHLNQQVSGSYLSRLVHVSNFAIDLIEASDIIFGP